MFEKLKEVESRYDELMTLVSNAAIQSNPSEYRKYSKALSEFQTLVEKYRDYKATTAEATQAQELTDNNDEDPELRELAKQELIILEERQNSLLAEIKVLLLPKDPNDERNVVLEIRAGTGGDEAGLFAADLFRMYSRSAETHGWRVDVLSSNETGVGAIKEIVALIEGQRVYSRLK